MPPVSELTQGVQKQQLANFIFNLQAEEFPVSSMIRKGPDVAAATFNFSVSKRTRRARTGVVNGSDVSEFNSTKRSPVVAYIQEFREPYGVDQRADVTEYAGVAKGNEVAFQKVQAMLALRQQMEQNLCSNDEMQLATDVLGYEARGLFKWLSPTEQTVNPVPTGYRPETDAVLTDTTLAAVTEVAVEALNDKIFRSRLGGKISLTMVAGEKLQAQFNKFSVYSDAGAAFATFPVRTWSQEKGTVVRSVTKLQFTNGTIDLVPSAHIMTTKGTGEDSGYTPYSGIAFPKDVIDTRWQKQIEAHELEDKGGGPRGYYNCMMASICYQPRHCTYITAQS
jgi:hypothetical protein